MSEPDPIEERIRIDDGNFGFNFSTLENSDSIQLDAGSRSPSPSNALLDPVTSPVPAGGEPAPAVAEPSSVTQEHAAVNPQNQTPPVVRPHPAAPNPRVPLFQHLNWQQKRICSIFLPGTFLPGFYKWKRLLKKLVNG